MPFVIPYQDFVDIVDGKKSELTLNEIPIEDLNKAVGFSYRWLPHKNATVRVTYLPHEFTVETGINADLTCLKAAVKRNPAEFYWMDCLCVPQDPEMPQKLKEIANMRLYYSNFCRVVFVGTLKDPQKPDLAQFEVISLKNCSQALTPEQMQKLRSRSGPEFEDQVAMIGEPRILSEDGWKIVNNLNNAFEQGFSLNAWHTRAWTVQEIAVAREIEFMGMLGNQKDISHFLFTCDWTRGLTDDGLHGDSLMDGLMTPIKMMEQNEMTALMFNAVLTERQAFFSDDIFYAILPLLDETVSGLNHLQMWDKVRLKYQHALLGFATQFPKGLSIWSADPYWFGMHNRAVTKKVSPKYETKALVEGNKATLNWTVGDRKYTIILNVGESNVLEGKAPVSIKEGHAEETEEWKVHVFTHKDAVTQGNANS